jgi:signal transduction histidine kinase
MNSRRIGAAAWYLFTALYAAIVCAWLLIGLAVALTALTTSWHAWALAAAGGRHGSAWISIGKGLIAAAAHSYPTTSVILDYIYSAANLLIAAALFRLAPREWTIRLLAIGLAGTAAAFNLQAHTTVQAVAVATGVQTDGWSTALLHGVGGTAYVVALLLFPTGTLPQFAHRTATARALLLAPALAVAALFATLTAQYPHTLTFVLFFGLLIPLEAGVAQWSRFSRAATTEVREQSRILLWALGIACAAAVLISVIALSTQALQTPGLPRDVPGISIGMPGLTGSLPGVGGIGTQVVAFWIFRIVSLALPCSVLVAMMRFRLGAVEQLLNRALVYGGLVAIAGGAYVFLVVRVDAWFGLDSDWLAPPQVAAAGLVALAFHPLRTGLERWADRLVYGRRVAPYDVLAQVSALSQTSGSAESLLSLARIAAEGLRTGFAVVYLDLEDGTRATYAWPTDAPTDESTVQKFAVRREIPVAYQGTSVGALAIPEASGRWSGADRSALLDHLTRAAAVVMHNAGLAIELENKLRVTERHAAEIRASRWRIVAAQDSERRELERNLHDGAQPALTAVRLSLGLATYLSASGNPKAREALTRLRDQIDDASVGLRQTLRGLAPAALGERGIGRALRELAESLGTDAAFRIDDETADARFAPEIEAAVYFCCAEAIQNAAKHCPAATVNAALRINADTAALSFTVADDGPGFDAAASTGSGMQNMADRIAAVGGTLNIESAFGEGTSVRGTVPAKALPDQPVPSPDEGEAARLAGERA